MATSTASEQPTVQQTPDEILRAIDLQLASRRTQRGRSEQNRGLLLAGGLLFIVLGAGAALFILQVMLSNLPTSGRNPPRAATDPGFVDRER